MDRILDRRVATRYLLPKNFNVRFQKIDRNSMPIGDPIDAKGINMGFWGIHACLEVDVDTLKKDDEVKADFSPGATSIQVTGKVKWTKKRNHFLFAGIQFVDFDERSRDTITRFLKTSNMNLSIQLEYEARNEEIRQAANNAFTITNGMIMATIALLGVNIYMSKEKFFYLLPLLLIQLGFEQYKTQMKKIRRMGNYVLCFIEQDVRDFRWEGMLNKFRKLTHSLNTNQKDRDRFYSLGYYWVALWLAILCFGIELMNMMRRGGNGIFEITLPMWKAEGIKGISARITAQFVQSSDILYLVFFILVFFYYFCYRLPKMKLESKEFEGGGKFDQEMFDLWLRVRQLTEGICSDKEHFKRLLEVTLESDFPGNKKIISELCNKQDCRHQSNCLIRKEVEDLLEMRPSVFRLLGNGLIKMQEAFIKIIKAFSDFLAPFSIVIGIIASVIVFSIPMAYAAQGVIFVVIWLLAGFLWLVHVRRKYWEEIKIKKNLE